MFAQQTRVSSTTQRVQEIKIGERAIFKHDKFPIEIRIDLLSSTGSKVTFDGVQLMLVNHGNVDLIGFVIAYSTGGNYILFEDSFHKTIFRFSQNAPFYTPIIDALIKVLSSDKNRSNITHIAEIFAKE